MTDRSSTAERRELLAAAADRFWANVERRGKDDCWHWKGIGARRVRSPQHSYGTINIAGRSNPAHRVSYELSVGPIPERMVIDHLCRTPSCVNPNHLEPVTPKVNTMRGIGPSAQNLRKTHCDNGHEFTPENTMFSGPDKRWRQCVACDRAKFIKKSRQKRLQARGWSMDEIVKVEQVDREAAAVIFPARAASVLRGDSDETILVQQLARHRTLSEADGRREAALAVAQDEWRKWAGQVENGGGLRARQAAESINRIVQALTEVHQEKNDG